MIKRQLLATVSCLALTGAASAADIPARMPVKAAPAPVVTQIWAGPYIGINGGAVWHRMDVDTTRPVFGLYDSARLRTTGGTFGGQIGYNWQSQNFVYGLEADANWVGAKKSHLQITDLVPISYTTKLSWLATLRARGGVTFGPNLLFLTGGLAVGGVKNSWAFPPPAVCVGSCELTNNKTKAGWTAGGGIERFISNNLTGKAEVLYVDLGRTTATGGANGNYTSRFKNTAVVGRLGLNLKW